MNPEAILAQSYKLLTQGDAMGAEAALAALWNASDQKSPKAMHLLALIRRSQNRLAEAEQWLRASAAAEPGDPETHYSLGELLAATNFHATAVDCFSEALRLAPQLDVARLALARALIALGRGGEAEREARALLQRRPTPEGFRALGAALAAQGRGREALTAFEEALRLRPDYLGAQYDRAATLQRLGRPDDALTLLGQLARTHAAPEIALARADVLLNVRRAPEAEDVLIEAVQQRPDNVLLQSNLARLRWLRGEHADDFARDFEMAVANDPANELLRATLAELVYRADRADYAQSLLRDGLTISPDSVPLWRMLGFLVDESGKPEEAVAALEQAYARGQDMETRKLLAHALLRIGAPERALEHIRFGLGHTPHDQLWLAYLTTAQRMRGDDEFAKMFDVNTCVRVVDLAPPPDYRDIYTFNATLAPRLDALHTMNRHPLNHTVRGGSQTLRDLSEVGDPVIDQFLALAKAAALDFAASMPSDPFHPFFGRRSGAVTLTGAWSVRLQPGGRCLNHVHQKGWISGTYYARLPQTDRADAPHAGWFKIGEPRVPIPNCPTLGFIEPKVGRLVMYPSYMWHGVETFARDDRLSVSFDAAPA